MKMKVSGIVEMLAVSDLNLLAPICHIITTDFFTIAGFNELSDQGVQHLVAALASPKFLPALIEMRLYRNKLTDRPRGYLLREAGLLCEGVGSAGDGWAFRASEGLLLQLLFPSVASGCAGRESAGLFPET